MLLGEIISNVRKNVVQTTFKEMSDIRPRDVYFTLLRKRATVIENRLRDDKKLAKTNSQVIACAQLVPSSPAECNCLDLVGCKIYRTVCKLPKTLTNTVSYDITNVTSIDGSLVFIKTDWSNFNSVKYKKYTSNYPHYMVYNDYIYVINNFIDGEPVEYISYAGIFEDPIRALECNACIGGGTTTSVTDTNVLLPRCDSIYDFEFPLTGKLLDTAVQLTLQELIRNFNPAITDAYQRATDLQSDEL